MATDVVGLHPSRGAQKCSEAKAISKAGCDVAVEVRAEVSRVARLLRDEIS
jgi:hypothetical protein